MLGDACLSSAGSEPVPQPAAVDLATESAFLITLLKKSFDNYLGVIRALIIPSSEGKRA